MHPTRRQFLQQVAAGTSFALERELATTPIPAIDTHTHFYDPTRQQGVPWPPSSDALLYKPHLPNEFQTLTQPYQILGTVVVEASHWVEDNQWILDLAQAHTGIVGFIGNLTLGQSEFATHLKRFGANPLFRGLRLNGRALANGLGQRAFESDVQRLAERQFTLDVLGNAAMLPDVMRIAKLAPRLRIVIDHLPFNEWDSDVPVLRKALADVVQLPNVYAKVSNVARRADERVIDSPSFYRPALDALWELFGADRLIYGSNWPVSNRVAPYAALHKIVADYFNAKGPIAAEKFFWKNSLAAYRWQARGAARKLVK